MDLRKNLKVCVFDPDLNYEPLFGFEILDDEIIFSTFADYYPSPEFRRSFEKFGLSLNVVFQILYDQYMKDKADMT